ERDELPGRPLVDGDPREVGGYCLLRRLGEGGMGVVYLGTPAPHPDDSAPRYVAVKVIRPDLAHSAVFRELFRREAAIARRVPSFCTAEFLVDDLDHEPAYLVTDYVPGPTLDDVILARGPLASADLVQLAINTATALRVIHNEGLIHRDLKPG